MKQMKPKKKNQQDLTLRNLRALKRRVDDLEDRLNSRVDLVWCVIDRLSDRISALEDKALDKKGKKK